MIAEGQYNCSGVLFLVPLELCRSWRQHLRNCSPHSFVIIETVQPRAARVNPISISGTGTAQVHRDQGGEAMTKSAADFAERNTERAVQVTKYGMDWLREVAEQNLDQSKASVETLVIATRKAVHALDQQTSAVLGRSMLAAEETLSNTFDFLHKLVRMKDPQELAQLQSEFVSRQAQVLADQTKEFGQTLMQGTSEMAKTTERTAETIRKLSEAA
jgi:hypothetical protein